MATINNSAFWIGTDGNAYVKGPAGIQKYTNPTNVTDGGFDGLLNGIQGQSVGASRIPDPNPPKTAPPPNPTGNTAPTHPALNVGAVNNTQATIDQIPGLLQAALAAEGQTHQNTINAFNEQEQLQQGQHDAGTATNQQNYDSTFMDAIRAGIHGFGSLMSLLRGTGAAGGSADKQVQDVVGGTTANDIRTGADTRNENQGQLDSALSSFLTDLKGKRQANEDTYANNQHAIQRDSNSQLQDLYSKMAGFYGDSGDTGAANDWMSRAGSLTPSIAADSRTQVTPYDTTPIVVHAPNLTAFAPPSQPDVAAPPTDGQVGSGIFTMSNTKRKDPTAALAPAGA